MAACTSMMSRITNRSYQARAFNPTVSSSDSAARSSWQLPAASGVFPVQGTWNMADHPGHLVLLGGER